MPSPKLDYQSGAFWDQGKDQPSRQWKDVLHTPTGGLLNHFLSVTEDPLERYFLAPNKCLGTTNLLPGNMQLTYAAVLRDMSITKHSILESLLRHNEHCQFHASRSVQYACIGTTTMALVS